MPVLSDLEPREVFAWFERLCAIPHGSHHAKAISDYLVAFARERGLACRQDAANNVVIRKAASAGYENAPVVMLQGHIDMVCEKDADCGKDMETEGLDLFVDGDVIGARGTTLGGDDGIAVAMALAVLDADDIPHGPLECVFTADEEVGMIGAHALDASDLKAKYLINIDSEEEGVLTVSCAGACHMACTLPVTRVPFDGQTLRVRISGLAGGHSGEEIHKGRANANLLLGRALDEMSRAGALRLIRVSGGAKDNAIPREAEAVVRTGDAAALRRAAEALAAALRALLRVPSVRLALDRGKLTMPVFGKLHRIICTARFARTISSLYASGLPIITALQTARDTIGNAYIVSQFDAVLAQVRSGVSLSAALESVDGFQRKLCSSIAVGEETGQLDSMLDSIADSMEYDAQQASRRMMTILEPMLIVLMAFVVGFIIIAVMSPIIGSYSAIESSGNV